jgi:prophage regulatory protein
VPRQLSGKRVGWLVRELEEWCESRPVSSNLPVANCGLRNT